MALFNTLLKRTAVAEAIVRLLEEAERTNLPVNIERGSLDSQTVKYRVVKVPLARGEVAWRVDIIPRD